VDSNPIIRSLRHEDYDDILKISKEIWDGEDYLPRVFHHWVDAPGILLGIEDPLSHEVVTVAHVALLPDKSAWFEGLRVRSDFRGQGLSRKIMQVQMEYALEKLHKGSVARIASTTFIENETSIHLSLSSGFKRKGSYLFLTWNPKDTSIDSLRIEPWKPAWEEIRSIPYFQETDDRIIQFFMVQKISEAWWEKSKTLFQFYKVNGARGWLDLGHEPHCVALDPSKDSILNWLQFASSRFGNDASTIIYPNPSRIEELKTTKVRPWSDWVPDCLYFVYEGK
jgi:RimJ/RimL family protein N-acetyltransferase